MTDSLLVMYIYAALGFVLLFGGGELLVRGAISVSSRFGLSPLLVGMTVVAWCTSAPEVVVSVGAALDGSADISIGNVVGSNIVNVLGVVGISALITPILVNPKALRRDTGWMMGVSVALAALVLAGHIGRVPGFLLLGAGVFYVWYSYRKESQQPCEPEAQVHLAEAEEIQGPDSVWLAAGYLLVGLGVLVLGSRLLITGATSIAQSWGVSEAVVGLTLVALGTSLPELATSVVAALRGHSDVAVGNVVGSNLTNIYGVIGITAIVQPIAVAEQIAQLDIWVMLATSAALAALMLVRGRIGRRAGLVFVSAYVAYFAFLF